MKLLLKTVGVFVLVIVVIAIAGAGFYWYRNIHWYDKYDNALRKVNAQEKQVTLPNGRIMNYGLHEYNQSDQLECWEAYYLRHCYWGQLFMEKGMPGIANYAQHYHEKHPEEAVKIGFKYQWLFPGGNSGKGKHIPSGLCKVGEWCYPSRN